MCAAMQPQNDTMWHKHTNTHTQLNCIQLHPQHTYVHTARQAHARLKICWRRVPADDAPAAAAEAIFLHFMQTNQLNGRIYLPTIYATPPSPAPPTRLTLKRNQQLNVFIFMPSWLCSAPFTSTFFVFGCCCFSFYFGCFCRNVYDRQANTKFI